MRALVFDKPGDAAAVLRLGEAPEPVLQPNGVLIEVRARVIQPADLLFVRGVHGLGTARRLLALFRIGM